MKRDPLDLEKLSYKLQSCSPFAPDPSLRNMFTGVVATKEINVTRFQEFGSRKVQELNGKAAFTCSFKRSRNAKTSNLPAFTCGISVSGHCCASGGQGWPISAFSVQWCANQKGDLLKSKAFVKPEKLLRHVL